MGAGHVVDEGLEFRVAALGLVFGEHRHEGGGKGALGKQPAQEVGDLEGDEEGVGGGVGAEQPCQHQVAGETQDARDQGVGAHGGQGLEQAGQGGGLRGSKGAL